MTQTNTHKQAEKVSAVVVIKPKVFLIRNSSSIQLGEITLDEETTKIYLQSSYQDRLIIRKHLTQTASEHYKVACYLSEVLCNHSKGY